MKRSVWIFGILFIFFSCINDANNFIDENPPNLRQLSFEEESLIESGNEFVFDLYAEISKRETTDNFFFSPLSVQYALGMTLNGADSTTFKAIRNALRNEELTEEDINKAAQSLTDFLLNVDKTTLIRIANSVWYRDDLTVKDAFKNAVIDYYDAGVQGIDFADPAAKDIINGWVAAKTENLIPDLIDAIPGNVVMYLINAIYFKAEWQHQFDKTRTEAGPFFLENGEQVNADLMYTEGAKIRYYRNEFLRLVDLPYGNGQYSMTILIPSLDHSLADIESSLSESDFNNWLSSSDTTTSEIVMPKFMIDYKTLLNDHLSDMGMEIASSPQADFSRLFQQDLGLMISRVIHQAVIEVNEEGSEAAAATAVEIVETSLPGEPEIITINRPFVFMIREKYSHSILFAGKLMDPTQ